MDSPTHRYQRRPIGSSLITRAPPNRQQFSLVRNRTQIFPSFCRHGGPRRAGCRLGGAHGSLREAEQDRGFAAPESAAAHAIAADSRDVLIQAPTPLTPIRVHIALKRPLWADMNPDIRAQNCVLHPRHFAPVRQLATLFLVF